jgi:hypothetical protein
MLALADVDGQRTWVSYATRLALNRKLATTRSMVCGRKSLKWRRWSAADWRAI